MKNRYEILRKTITSGSLISETSQNWYDSFGQVIPWSGSVYIGPNQNDIIYNTNVTGTLIKGYYKWTGTTWNLITSDDAYDNYNIPIFLNTTSDEMGVMVGFDGDIEQVEQLVNFSYSGVTGTSTVTVYNTVNTDRLRTITDATYTINWGDNTTSNLSISSTGPLGSVSKTYSTSGEYKISVTVSSPWATNRVEKIIKVPFNTTVTNPLGTFTGTTIPAYANMTGQTLNYLNDFDYTNVTGTTTGFTYLAIGNSSLSQKLKYGQNPNLITSYSGVTTGTDSVGNYTGYTIGDLYYRDYVDKYTMITGTTVGITKEEVFSQALTRNEHFLGFVDEPVIFSDVFVERGKQSVMEMNLRLNEIDSMGELNIYGNGFYNIRKQ